MKTLTIIGDITARNLGRFFLQVLMLYVTLGLGMIAAAAYGIRRLWQARTLRPARVTVRAVR